MLRLRLLVIPALLGLASPALSAQAPASAGRIQPLVDLAERVCIPSLATEPLVGPRLAGDLHVPGRELLLPHSTMLVDAGRNQGLAVGEEYVVRRLIRSFGAQGPSPEHPLTVQTAGWVRITNVTDSAATATIVYTCGAIHRGDHLQPLDPSPAAPSEGVDAGSIPSGHVVLGADGRQLAATGDLVTIDLGREHGIGIGQSLSIYRPPSANAETAATVGRSVVVAVASSRATVRIVEARDAIRLGDIVAGANSAPGLAP